MVKARGSLWSCITNLFIALAWCLISLLKQSSYSPAKGLLVVAVDLARLLELGDELADGLGIILGVEVNDESVDHDCGLKVV
jgi:hypothetical protein